MAMLVMYLLYLPWAIGRARSADQPKTGNSLAPNSLQDITPHERDAIQCPISPSATATKA
jgi:hypothetical protein